MGEFLYRFCETKEFNMMDNVNVALSGNPDIDNMIVVAADGRGQADVSLFMPERENRYTEWGMPVLEYGRRVQHGLAR